MARNILVVEDDRNISDLIRMYLEKEGFDVRIAYDGGKAVEEYDRQAPDMVLLDIMLPVMDGWSVCAHIREKAKTPIIMLTAKSEVNDRITGLEMGADDYLVKPFEMKELMARINAVLRRSEIPDDTRKRLVFDKLEINLDSYELRVDGDSLAGIRFVMRMPRRSRDLHIANKAVVDHDPLGTILADPLRFKHINVVDQLHKPLITDLSGGVVLIELFIEPGNGVVPGHGLLQFLLTALLLP